MMSPTQAPGYNNGGAPTGGMIGGPMPAPGGIGVPSFEAPSAGGPPMTGRMPPPGTGGMGQPGSTPQGPGGTGGAFGRDYGGMPSDFREVEAQTFPGADLEGYMNPYTSEVTGNAIREMERSGKRSRNDIGAQAVSGGAFGGSRHAIQEGLQREGESRAIGDLSAKLYGANFTNAQNQFQTDASRGLTADRANQDVDFARQGMDRSQFNQQRGRELTADLANQSAGMQAGSINRSQYNADQNRTQQAAELMNLLGREQSGSGYRDAAALETVGQQEQGLGQRLLDTDYADFREQRQWPFEMLNTRLGAMSGTPYSISKSGQEAGGSTAGQIAGLAAAVPGIVGLFGK